MRIEQDEPQIQPGYDAPFPENWQRMPFRERQLWARQHQITDPQRIRQQQEELARAQERRQQEALERAESAARWERFYAALDVWPMRLYAMGFLAWGLIQRRLRWRELLRGVRWHTYSRGVSPLMPFLGGRMREANILRIADPALCLVVSGMVFWLLSGALGAWLLFCSLAFAMIEQRTYEYQLNLQLDQLDAMIDSDVLGQNVRKGPQALRLEETGGVLPTGAAAPELAEQVVKRREERRARIKERAAAHADEEGVRSAMAEFGIDPDDPEAYEKMTPEERADTIRRATAAGAPGGGIAMPGDDDDRL